MRDAAIAVGIGLAILVAAPPAPAQESAPAAAMSAASTGSGGAGSASADGIRAFWRGMGDATLDRLVDELLRGNLDVRAAAARLDGARAARREAELERWPTGGLDGGYTRQRLSPAAFPFPSGPGSLPDQDIWDVGLGATWELDLSGRLRHNLAARRELEAAGGADLADVQVALAAELARTYCELRGLQEQLAVARRNTANQQRTLDLTKERLDAGRGTAFDSERAAAQLAFTAATIPLFESAVASARFRIAALVGRPAGAGDDGLGEPAPLPAPPPAPEVGRLDELVGLRPDVAAAERRAAAESAFVGAARSAGHPTFTLGASAGYTATALGAFGDPGTFRYMLTSGISWPAFGLGRVNAGVAQARAQEQQAQAGLERLRLDARQEIASALERYRGAQERARRVGDAASSSARAAELARLRFSDGLGDLLDVLDAERTQLEAERQLAQARTEEVTSYVGLYRALGGAWPQAGTTP